MTERIAKYIVIPVPTGRWVPSALMGGMRPEFSEFKMLREDYDRLISQGGKEALDNWLLDRPLNEH